MCTSLLDIPAMSASTTHETNTAYRGGGNYVTTVESTTKEDYLAYLILLKEHGFTEIANQNEGWGGTVFSTTLQRDSLILTVVHYTMTGKTKISFYTGIPSKRLNVCEKEETSYLEGAKTTMHMIELWWFGNSFLFQLKNGHFIISDGGYRNDLAYLLDYMESLTPDGEKPIVDAWIITHAHGDHVGALMTLVEMHQEWFERICVEGVYISEPSDEVLRKCGGHTPHAITKMAANLLKTAEGEQTKLYRPQTGQRYYFCDITVDILYSQEQIEEENYTNLNEASTVCLFTIEGQKCFLSGDVHENGLEFLMQNYTREFLNLDFFTLNHHGYNTSQEFLEYATIETALITRPNMEFPAQRIRETKYLTEIAKESISWGDGTTVFAFPYTVGSFERLENNTWKYDTETEKLTSENHMYSLWGNAYTGFIFDAEASIFEGETLKDGVLAFLEFAKEKQVHLSVYSEKTTSVLKASLEQNGILDYFELILGNEMLQGENRHAVALTKSEAKFQTNHHKLVVLCNTIDAVEAVLAQGVKTAVIAEEFPDEAMIGKTWKHFVSYNELIDYLISRDVIYK